MQLLLNPIHAPTAPKHIPPYPSLTTPSLQIVARGYSRLLELDLPHALQAVELDSNPRANSSETLPTLLPDTYLFSPPFPPFRLWHAVTPAF